MRSGLSPRSERPCTRTSPAAGWTTPITAWRVEDLPAPFGPTRPTISPAPTSRSSPRTAGTPAYSTSSVSRTSAGSDIAAAPAEVRIRDVDVPPDLVRRALRKRSPLVEHLDAVADLQDQRHVVVDEEHACAVLVADGAHDCREVGHLGLGEAGRGLVQQDEARLGRERTGDAELALVAVRQRRCR